MFRWCTLPAGLVTPAPHLVNMTTTVTTFLRLAMRQRIGKLKRHSLFKNSPARREDFTSVTGSDLFPKRFCQTRWVENVSIAEWLLKMWLHVQKYLAACKEGRLPSPKNKSFSRMSACCDEPLFLVRVSVFLRSQMMFIRS